MDHHAALSGDIGRRVYDADLEDDSTILNNFGGTISYAPAQSSVAFSFTGFYGSDEDSVGIAAGPVSTYDYEVSRGDYEGLLEYRPQGSTVTFLFGVRHITTESTITNPSDPTGVYEYNRDMTVAEVGIRLSTLLRPESRHAFTAQAVVGVGAGTQEERGTATSVELISEEIDGTAVIGEVAFGYSYLVTNNFALGARLRGFVFGVDVTDEGDLGLAVGPEFNATFRF